MSSFVAIDIGMLNNYFCAYSTIALSEVGTSLQHAFNDCFAYFYTVQAEVDKTSRYRNLFNGGGAHIAQNGGERFCNLR